MEDSEFMRRQWLYDAEPVCAEAERALQDASPSSSNFSFPKLDDACFDPKPELGGRQEDAQCIAG